MNPHSFLLLILTFLVSTTQAQIVNIPDANLKFQLVGNTSINTNNDANIQVSEAQAYAGGIFVQNKSIANMTGIEAFTSITKLYCYGNTITSLNVTNATALTELRCEGNQLTSLNVSTNTALVLLRCENNLITTLTMGNNVALAELRCENNQLTTLNLANCTALATLHTQFNFLSNLSLNNNTALTSMRCEGNTLTSLNTSNNTALTSLVCHGNSLTDLDMSNNTALNFLHCQNNQLMALNVKNGNNMAMPNSSFIVSGNSNLTCVEVDNAAWSTSNWTFKDATASYSVVCNTNIIETAVLSSNISVFPNPTNDKMTIQFESNQEKISLKLFNALGQQVLFKEYQDVTAIDLNLQVAAGVYYVQLNDKIVRIVKR